MGVQWAPTPGATFYHVLVQEAHLGTPYRYLAKFRPASAVTRVQFGVNLPRDGVYQFKVYAVNAWGASWDYAATDGHYAYY
jgi:hypothetical protein